MLLCLCGAITGICCLYPVTRFIEATKCAFRVSLCESWISKVLSLTFKFPDMLFETVAVHLRYHLEKFVFIRIICHEEDVLATLRCQPLTDKFLSALRAGHSVFGKDFSTRRW